jgi:hypothetical protein
VGEHQVALEERHHLAEPLPQRAAQRGARTRQAIGIDRAVAVERRGDRDHDAAGLVGLAEVDRERGVADRRAVGCGDHRHGRRHVLGQPGLVEHDVERVAVAGERDAVGELGEPLGGLLAEQLGELAR